MHLEAGLLASLGQRLEKILAVHIIVINLLAPITPTHQTLWRSCLSCAKANVCQASIANRVQLAFYLRLRLSLDVRPAAPRFVCNCLPGIPRLGFDGWVRIPDVRAIVEVPASFPPPLEVKVEKVSFRFVAFVQRNTYHQYAGGGTGLPRYGFDRLMLEVDIEFVINGPIRPW